MTYMAVPDRAFHPLDHSDVRRYFALADTIFFTPLEPECCLERVLKVEIGSDDRQLNVAMISPPTFPLLVVDLIHTVRRAFSSV
mmetsp:Transcript_6732/g.9791  ORF Transcript_6732/g.9791 Transcript_6732/m.9791 type:complete len:84 (-) Transcript_6732:330-581(-)